MVRKLSQQESKFLIELDDLLRRSQASAVSCNGREYYAVGDIVIIQSRIENMPFSRLTKEEIIGAKACDSQSVNGNNKVVSAGDEPIKISPDKLTELVNQRGIYKVFRDTAKGRYSFFEEEDICSRSEFEKVSRPLIKYLAENHHPHTMAIVESDRVVLWEGKMNIPVGEYIVD